MSAYTCKICSQHTYHDEQWDSYFCPICNTWNENKCSWEDCSYCINRPDKPLRDNIHEVYTEAYDKMGVEAVFWLLEECHNEGIY